ncbi:MAG: hypothetical protein JRJ57_09770 [Deltaproteobacteria bacterium]|nr:hypothetical protein [Deltaproteobacteria bacterium]
MKKVEIDSPSVQSYIGILQSVIGRMGSNSASCKTWCITLVSAIIVVVSRKNNPCYIWIAMVPILLFFFLDSYYLGLEQCFRDLYNKFVEKLQEGEATIEDVFIITPDADLLKTIVSTFKAALSLSIWPFYIVLIVMLSITEKFLF